MHRQWKGTARGGGGHLVVSVGGIEGNRLMHSAPRKVHHIPRLQHKVGKHWPEIRFLKRCDG
jgi:hypothetical protein